jgi:predicted nucleic acid-binding protein
MTVLLDSNVLLRLAQATHPMHPIARAAVTSLQQAGKILHTVPQTLYEFWVVTTRPVAANGLGLTAAETDAELNRIEVLFSLLPDTPAVFAEWRRLVVHHQITGKKAHDARLVASMAVHGLTHLLTFNSADFAPYTGIVVLDPTTAPPPRP